MMDLLIEPERYYPIIPMVLINGTKGIGTGWSTDIPQYNPIDIINMMKKLLNNEELEDNLNLGIEIIMVNLLKLMKKLL